MNDSQNMPRPSISLFFLFCILISSIHVQSQSSTKNLYTNSIDLNEGDSLQLPASGSVWVENGDVLEVQNQDHQIHIRGKAKGRSELRIGKNEFSVSVYDRDQNRTFRHLEKVLTRTLGLQIKKENSEVIISGQLLRIEDWDKLSKSCQELRCKYSFRAFLSGSLATQFSSHFADRLKVSALFPYRLEMNSSPQIHLAEGHPQIKEISNLAESYGIKIILSSTSLALEPIVKVHITVAEVKKSTANKYGIGWPDSYQAKLLPAGQLNDPLEVSLHAMEALGEGKILASPNLICRSGKEAEFFAGGEFPIKIINFKIQDIVWKKYGILLKVKPTADMSGRMSITLETEVSGFDGSKSVDGFPGLYLNRVQSTFDLTESRTIALSGLLKKEDHEQSQGLLGLANLPILGTLFSSKDYREDKTELIIFVRPEISNLTKNGDLPND